MNADDLKQQYGDEHPAAIVVDRIRITLSRETRFWRYYVSDAQKAEHRIPRFMDGSASMTAAQLQREWPTWTSKECVDFCYACYWLHKQADFEDMLRFIMQHGGTDHWSGIALSVGSQLPRDEAFRLLARALRCTDIGRCSNITQGIALTKHPNAETTLRDYLWAVWEHPRLWDDDDFLNWPAQDAMWCIANLVELGAPPRDFEEHVRRLSQHICSRNRDSCRTFLSKHYSWLK